MLPKFLGQIKQTKKHFKDGHLNIYIQSIISLNFCGHISLMRYWVNYFLEQNGKKLVPCGGFGAIYYFAENQKLSKTPL